MKVIKRKQNLSSNSNAVKPLHNLIFKNEKVLENDQFSTKELNELNSESFPKTFYTNQTQHHFPIYIKDVLTKKFIFIGFDFHLCAIL